MSQKENPIHPVREQNCSTGGVSKKIQPDAKSPLPGNLPPMNFSNRVKKFFKNLAQKVDQKMLEKSKSRPCCCKDKPKDAR